MPDPAAASPLGRILVFGAGSLGCYFAAILTKSGADVALVARGDTLRAISIHGIVLEGLSGDYSIHPNLVTDDLAAIRGPTQVLLAVKAWQVKEAARQLAAVLSADSSVLTLQNGVDAPDEVAAELGAARTLAGVCRITCTTVARGRVRHAGLTPSLVVGHMSRAPLTDSEMGFAGALAKAGVQVEVEPGVQPALWRKLVFIAAFAGVGSVCREPIGVVRARWASLAMMRAVVRESAAVAESSGVFLGEGVVDETMVALLALPENAESSMQRDIVDGRPSELDAIIGALIRRADAACLSTPTLRHVHASLIIRERAARGVSQAL